MQIPGAGCGGDDIIAYLNDRRGNVADTRYIVEELAFAAQEAAIHEVVALDSRHGQSELILAPLLDVGQVAVQETGGGFPYPPGAGRRPRRLLGAAVQPL